MRLPEQVTRLGAVILAVLAVVLLLRFVVLPASMFSAKPHQAAKVVREMAKPVRHAGMQACRECHAATRSTRRVPSWRPPSSDWRSSWRGRAPSRCRRLAASSPKPSRRS